MYVLICGVSTDMDPAKHMGCFLFGAALIKLATTLVWADLQWISHFALRSLYSFPLRIFLPRPLVRQK
jgi:hypothetical protein